MSPILVVLHILVADIPGLIEGAHRNVGLGFEFLRHVQRCHSLFFILDYTLGEWREQLEALRDECRLYAPELDQKRTVLVVNKVDLMKDEVGWMCFAFARECSVISCRMG